MRLTRQSEIAIAILGACARRPEGYVQTNEAALEAGATRLHTAKIVNLLVHAGLLTTSRGRRGGVALAQPSGSISLSAVLRHTQPAIVESSGPARRANADRSSLDIIVHAARGTFVTLMDRFTIADLIVGRSVDRLACFDCSFVRSACPAMPAASLDSCHERSEPHVEHTHC